MMSQYPRHEINNSNLHQDLCQTESQLICICCLQKNLQLISLTNCRHSYFLNNFTIPNIKTEAKVVCFLCHSMLKKIHEFKQQVQKNFDILKKKTGNIESDLKPTRLKIEKTVEINIKQHETWTGTPVTLEDAEDKGKKTTESRLRNIQTALDIIEGNNSLPLMGLLNGIQSMRNDILGSTANNSTSLQKSQNSQSVDVFVKNEKPCNQTFSHQHTELLQKRKRPNPIRKVKLTKKQLMRERYFLSKSKQYLKYPYKCKNCIQGFNFKENLEDHIVRKHAQRGHTCDICMQTLPEGIDVHMQRHFCRYTCVKCLKMFVSRDYAVCHYARQHMRHECEVCGYMVRDIMKMKLHRMRHRFLCKQCGVVLTTPRKLQWHVKMKHSTTNFTDPVQ